MTRHLLLFAVVAAMAGAPTAADAQATLSAEEAKKIATDVQTLTGQAQDAAMDKMQAAVRADPAGTKDYVIDQWCDALFAAHQPGKVTVLTFLTINAVPYDTSAVVTLQKIRVRAYLRMAAWDHAVQAGKGLYNVCPVDQVDDAVNLLTAALKGATKHLPKYNDRTLVERFQLEQKHGATITTPIPTEASPSTNPSARSVLASIVVAERRWGPGLKAMKGNDYLSLIGRANLLLLNDQTEEARKALDQAKATVDAEHEGDVTEAISRLLKAEDGSVGRARAWLHDHGKATDSAPKTEPSSP